MNSKGIIKNQKVKSEKKERSRELRRNMTPAEREFWEIVRDRRLHSLKFRRQQVIDGFIIDFYCDSLGLCVEIDGGVHDSLEQAVYDREREEVLRLRGLTLLRFKNQEVLENRETFLERLKEAIDTERRKL